MHFLVVLFFCVILKTRSWALCILGKHVTIDLNHLYTYMFLSFFSGTFQGLGWMGVHVPVALKAPMKLFFKAHLDCLNQEAKIQVTVPLLYRCMRFYFSSRYIAFEKNRLPVTMFLFGVFCFSLPGLPSPTLLPILFASSAGSHTNICATRTCTPRAYLGLSPTHRD